MQKFKINTKKRNNKKFKSNACKLRIKEKILKLNVVQIKRSNTGSESFLCRNCSNNKFELTFQSKDISYNLWYKNIENSK